MGLPLWVKEKLEACHEKIFNVVACAACFWLEYKVSMQLGRIPSTILRGHMNIKKNEEPGFLHAHAKTPLTYDTAFVVNPSVT